ncbi:MAG: DUF4352 domain-containing protein [Bryobacteraceae bacterium]|nr:DUF4352 domain-containing protein [Bryobacteraceae bacterium]
MNLRLILIAGLLGASAIIGVGLFVQWGKHLELEPKVMKVRTGSPVENATIVLVDLRLNNLSERTWVVNEVQFTVEAQDGRQVDGIAVAQMDLKRLFESLPTLGQTFNPLLKSRDKLAPKAMTDRMLVFQLLDFKETDYALRKSATLRITELDGAVTLIPLPKT